MPSSTNILNTSLRTTSMYTISIVLPYLAKSKLSIQVPSSFPTNENARNLVLVFALALSNILTPLLPQSSKHQTE